ncbi:acyltransferase [Brucella cytisi]|uniref:acyltransferase family protein n=1 Tax=Brucella cytisi TaxID=407152 RepID=UPI00313CE9AC
MQNRKQLYSIQILRGLAATAVLIAHTIEHPRAETNNAITMLGVFGVQLFFVISGFIIAYVNADGPFRPGDFLLRRVFRIVPLYWLCTITVFICALYLPSLFKTTVPDVGYFIKSLFFIPAATPGDPSDWRPIFKLGWSLNYELFFYLVFALFWWCKNALQRTILLTGIFGACVIGSFFVEPSASIAAFYLHKNLLTFMCGMWLAEAEKHRLWEKLSPVALAGIGILAIAALYGTFSTPLVAFNNFFTYLIMCGAAVLLVTGALGIERWLGDLRDNFFVDLGATSYSLYLTHMFVVGFGWAVMRKLNVGPTLEIAGMAAIVIGAIIAAKISYRLIELPSNRLGHMLTKRNKPSLKVAQAEA